MGRPTGDAVVLVDARGENVIAVAPGANSTLRADAVPRSVAELAGPRGVVVASLEIPVGAVAAAGGPFVLNAAPARRLPAALLCRCAAVVLNAREIAAFAGGSAEGLLAQGAGAVLVTRGRLGMELWQPERPAWRQPALPIDAADTVGAGDASVAAVAVTLAGGGALEAAARRAAVAGALATRGAGARGGLSAADELARLLPQLPPGGPGAYQA